ncbi:hypothetical protein HYD55_00835 [Mycoplasmopsis bovis]|nr:hypothetical protein [Mycoplasmopsis bovis]QQH71528.1 hypothetical protein HYD55_00835 [Mycoplasmopsis bovis]
MSLFSSDDNCNEVSLHQFLRNALDLLRFIENINQSDKTMLLSFKCSNGNLSFNQKRGVWFVYHKEQD